MAVDKADPPWRLDPLQNIINISWGGGTVFVYGTLSDNAIYYVKVKNSKDTSPQQKAIAIPNPGEFGFSAYGSSYHLLVENKGEKDEEKKPVFLLCGNAASTIATSDSVGNPVHIIEFHTMIYYSNDGLSWQIVRQQDSTPTFEDQSAGAANPAALVWHEDSFFYDQVISQNKSQDISEQIFSSSDGLGWGMISSNDTGASPDYVSDFPPSYCSQNDCLDNKGQHVPDGVMANDPPPSSINDPVPPTPPKKLTANPVLPPIINYWNGTSSVAFSSDGETWGGSDVRIVQIDDNGSQQTAIVSIPGLQKVFCVAGADGILMAGGSPDKDGGSGAVVLSLDKGQTWTMLAQHDSAVTTMSAAPALDIKSSQSQ
jgi:hypothetical protein